MQDRFADLRQIATRLNPTGAYHMRPGSSAVFECDVSRPGNFDIEAEMGINKTAASSQFMTECLTDLEHLKMEFSDLQLSVEKIRCLKKEALEALSPEAELRISEDLNSTVDECNKKILKIKTCLELLKKETEDFSLNHPNSSEAKIRENFHVIMTRKFREIINTYQSVQTEYKKDVKEKTLRQVKMIFPEATEEEATKIASGGDMSSIAAIRLRIEGQPHENLQNALNDLHNKYRDVRLLEQSVNELHQMFIDLATLVDAQGDLLDQIEFSVNSAKDYTEKGEQELQSVRKEQKKSKKRAACCGFCVLVPLSIAILIGVVFLVK